MISQAVNGRKVAVIGHDLVEGRPLNGDRGTAMAERVVNRIAAIEEQIGRVLSLKSLEAPGKSLRGPLFRRDVAVCNVRYPQDAAAPLPS